MNVHLCLDVGGTNIKTGILTEQGDLLGEMNVIEAMGAQNTNEILEHFTSTIYQMHSLFKKDPSVKMKGIHFAIPGPFDYENGISYMQGLDKYEALYGINIRKELQERLKQKGISDISIHFCNDVEAFALGEDHFGIGRELRNKSYVKKIRGMYICIGTGCGSAFLIDGKTVQEEEQGVPTRGWVYQLPFQDSIIDDYISKRGIQKIAKELLGQALDGKQLSMLAQKEEMAKRVFEQFGMNMLEAFTKIIDQFSPDYFVLGGAIMKSSIYFIEPLVKFCNEREILLHISKETSLRAIQGLIWKEKQ